MLNDAHTVDAVPVVRCTDCQFYAEGENEVDAWMYCKLHSMNTQPDNYCSWAVRVGKNDSHAGNGDHPVR